MMWWGHTPRQQQSRSAIRPSSLSLSSLPDTCSSVGYGEMAPEWLWRMRRSQENGKRRACSEHQNWDAWKPSVQWMMTDFILHHVFGGADFFSISLVRLKLLVFQPLPTLSGHRSMFTLAPQPEIWWSLVHASLWLWWMHQNASSRATSYIMHRAVSGKSECIAQHWGE